ncbi:unnamed protein product [Arctogadus glacialis]
MTCHHFIGVALWVSEVSERVIFNVVNFSKTKSLYRDGMSPVVKSTSRPKWCPYVPGPLVGPGRRRGREALPAPAGQGPAPLVPPYLRPRRQKSGPGQRRGDARHELQKLAHLGQGFSHPIECFTEVSKGEAPLFEEL